MTEEEIMRYKNLVLAVLLNGISDYQDMLRKNEAAVEEMEPAQWIRNAAVHPFSFIWCCDILGVPASKVRQRVGDKKLLSSMRKNWNMVRA